MKIRIQKEMYINNPCPEITKEIWDWFYGTLWRSYTNYDFNYVKKIFSIDIRINQAYEGCAKIHFYITINKGLKDEFDFHMVYYRGEKPPYERPRWEWMWDFTNHGEIDLGTKKHIIRYENLKALRENKRLTRRRVSSLVKEYKMYQNLKEKFGSLD